MLLYQLKIALTSLRRNPVITSLLIGGIALGICVSTTFIALRHVFEKDPLPGKSNTLFYVRLDNWDPQRAYVAEDPKSLPTMVTYRDARELMKSNIPTRQTATFRTRYFVHPDPKIGRPYAEDVRLVFADFFTMFNVPFQYGGPWDKAADAKPEPVIVIDQNGIVESKPLNALGDLPDLLRRVGTRVARIGAKRAGGAIFKVHGISKKVGG